MRDFRASSWIVFLSARAGVEPDAKRAGTIYPPRAHPTAPHSHHTPPPPLWRTGRKGGRRGAAKLTEAVNKARRESNSRGRAGEEWQKTTRPQL